KNRPLTASKGETNEDATCSPRSMGYWIARSGPKLRGFCGAIGFCLTWQSWRREESKVEYLFQFDFDFTTEEDMPGREALRLLLGELQEGDLSGLTWVSGGKDGDESPTNFSEADIEALMESDS